jgi:putative transposase
LDVKGLCEALDVCPATYYRSKKPEEAKPPRRSHRRLGDRERKEVLSMLTSETFIDMSVPEAYHTLLDQGQYVCSVSTMYAVLRENQAVKERRDQLKHPEYVKPVLRATGPNQVWSWDITKLKGPYKGGYYSLYKMIDIYSRFVVGWMVSEKENADLASLFIEQTCQKQNILRDRLTIHSDRGSPMKSTTVAEMLIDLGVIKSFSRPRVCNDNPFSESLFKTLKYHRTFPKQFGSIQDARLYINGFFNGYNHEHYHSGIAMMTPATVHLKNTSSVIQKRSQILEKAFEKHPERFVRGIPKPKMVPDEAWINNPAKSNLKVA